MTYTIYSTLTIYTTAMLGIHFCIFTFKLYLILAVLYFILYSKMNLYIVYEYYVLIILLILS